ncbi:MAG: lasso peptide biosynthesis B2 protein [Bacteroidia bacterium]|nr:lasso peptide biosynthesis B2 protein [Bacteroidia bacterium]
MTAAIKFLKINKKERWLFIEALYWSGISTLVIHTLPFRWYVSWLGKPAKEAPLQSIEGKDEIIRLVQKALKRAKKYVWWKNKCFAQAVAAKKMLRKRGIFTTLYLGLNTKEQNKIDAHAWISLGNIIIIGNLPDKEWKKIAIFS